MKKDIYRFIFKVLFLVVMVFSLIIYCEIKLKELPNTYSEKKRFFESKLDSVQILILGTSQPMEGINPVFFKMIGINLANNAQSFYYDKEITLKYIEKLPKLKFVLISISYFSLWFEIYQCPDSWRDNFYARVWGVKPNDPKLFDLKRISYISLYGPSIAQNAFRKRFNITGEIGPDEYNEYGWFYWKPPYSFLPTDSLGKVRVMSHKILMHDDLLANNIKYLDTLLSVITQKNITPVFLSSPVHITYFNNMDPEKIKEIASVINDLCLKYHCRYYNYNNDPRFDNSDFADEDHLNPQGAEKYSKIIDQEILSR